MNAKILARTRFTCITALFALPSSVAPVPHVEYRSLISHADITSTQAVARGEEDLPIGNGRMGTLAWTIPSSLKFQINRADVFANGCASRSFPVRHTDYCGGCGFVDIEFPGFESDVFPATNTSQHLSCYDGLVNVQGAGVQAEVVAWQQDDVFARITDKRPGEKFLLLSPGTTPSTFRRGLPD